MLVAAKYGVRSFTYIEGNAFHHLCSPVDDHCVRGMAGVDPDRGGEKMRGGSSVGSGMGHKERV